MVIQGVILPQNVCPQDPLKIHSFINPGTFRKYYILRRVAVDPESIKESTIPGKLGNEAGVHPERIHIGKKNESVIM